MRQIAGRSTLGRGRRVAATVAASLLAVAVLVATSGPASAQDDDRVEGAGSDLSNLIIQQWRADVARELGLRLDHVASDEAWARQAYLSGAKDFAAISVPVPSDDLPAVQSARPFVYVPIAVTGIAFVANLIGADGARVTALRLAAADVCRVFTEPGMRWTDPSIVASNPGVPLPNEPIRAVVRADESGESLAVSEFCIDRAATVWQAFRTAAAAQGAATTAAFERGEPTAVWPRLHGMTIAFRASGAAATVTSPSTGRNAVAYLDLRTADALSTPRVRIDNGTGEHVATTPAAAARGLAAGSWRADGTWDAANTSDDPTASSPAVLSYAVVPTTGLGAGTASSLARLIAHVVCAGQDRAEPLAYARLPTQLVDVAVERISALPGAPAATVFSGCGSGSGPPAVVPEAPLSILLPASTIAVAGTATWWFRRRRTVAA